MGSGVTGSGRSAVEWLASAAPDPRACRRQWQRDPFGVVLLPAGRLWDVLVVPAALGRPAAELLSRRTRRPGPVLCDERAGRVGFLVPPGTAGRWVGTGVRGVGAGGWVVVPHPLRGRSPVRWLVPPDGSGVLTDPVGLEGALHRVVGG
ncbi:bifunctional DNA primase/polymerase [Streptomyces luteireticuli]|uniref:DNA primase/polymerase bifunctional N-terminal domain-containing protein n=1 Tax=Streptomyces luteireticuli TaxID=173858 RepID=A0ABN0Z1D7_9ACTN